MTRLTYFQQYVLCVMQGREPLPSGGLTIPIQDCAALRDVGLLDYTIGWQGVKYFLTEIGRAWVWDGNP